MDTNANSGAQPGDKAKVEVEGTVAGDKADTSPKATTTVDTGTPSAKSATKPGPSKGLDTLDNSAKAFVKSGEKADASVKGMDAPSGEKLREDTTEADRAMALDNIENQATGSSNHNTAGAVNPVTVAQVDRPDYNPQRRPSSRANMASTVGEHPSLMAARVDAKKAAPTNAEIVQDRRDDANEERERPMTGYQSPYLGEN